MRGNPEPCVVPSHGGMCWEGHVWMGFVGCPIPGVLKARLGRALSSLTLWKVPLLTAGVGPLGVPSSPNHPVLCFHRLTPPEPRAGGSHPSPGPAPHTCSSWEGPPGPAQTQQGGLCTQQCRFTYPRPARGAVCGSLCAALQRKNPAKGGGQLSSDLSCFHGFNLRSLFSNNQYQFIHQEKKKCVENMSL